MTRDQGADVTGGDFVPERARRLCIGSRAFLNLAGPALVSAKGRADAPVPSFALI